MSALLPLSLCRRHRGLPFPSWECIPQAPRNARAPEGSGLPARSRTLHLIAINRPTPATNHLALFQCHSYLRSPQLAWQAWATLHDIWVSIACIISRIHCLLIALSVHIVGKFTNHFLFTSFRILTILETSPISTSFPNCRIILQ